MNLAIRQAPSRNTYRSQYPRLTPIGMIVAIMINLDGSSCAAPWIGSSSNGHPGDRKITRVRAAVE